MESPEPSSSPAPLTPQEKQRRARERRAAKIAAGGADRLNAITNLSGRKLPAPEGGPIKTTATPPPSQPSQFSRPSQPPRASVEDDLDTSHADNALISSLNASRSQSRSPVPGTNPFAFPGFDGADAGGDPNADPMMVMMQQMLRTMGGDDAGTGKPGGPGGPELPPLLQAMLNGQQQANTQGAQTSSAYIWRIVHALFSLSLAVYIALGAAFTGSKLDREGLESSSLSSAFGQRLFWIFATFELVMQSSRYFIERGQLPQSGWLATIASILPEPYAGYVRTVGRYSVIYTTVMSDAMVIVFVLGCWAWWNGLAEA